MYKEDFAFNNLQWLIYHKTKPNQIYHTFTVIKCNERINFLFIVDCFALILVVFALFLLSLRFSQISPPAFFRWFYRDGKEGQRWNLAES